MAARYFTVPEARAQLPRLREVLDALRRTRGQALLKKARIDMLWSRLEAGEPVLGTIAENQRELDGFVARLSAMVRDVEAIGCILRDIDAGLVDFPARGGGGRAVFLCWRLDEPDIGFWHGPAEGFAGRKPLRDLPAE